MKKKKLKKKFKSIVDDLFYLDAKVKDNKLQFIETAQMQTQKIEKLEKLENKIQKLEKDIYVFSNTLSQNTAKIQKLNEHIHSTEKN